MNITKVILAVGLVALQFGAGAVLNFWDEHCRLPDWLGVLLGLLLLVVPIGAGVVVLVTLTFEEREAR